MSNIVDDCVKAYRELKHLGLTGERLGISWQKVYIHLKKAGEPVCGDKARYGSARDRLAEKAERIFKKTVPFAVDNNETEFQSSIDFTIGDMSIDVKAASLRDPEKTREASKWGFSINKQKDTADFFVLYAFDGDGEKVMHIMLIPKEIAAKKSTISVPFSLKSKWIDYVVDEQGLLEFFEEMR